MLAQKRDANEPEIIGAFEGALCTVDQLPGGNGRGDLLVGDPLSRHNIFVEVKVPGKEKLNPLQKKYHAAWKGRIHLISNVRQALELLSFYRRGCV